MSSLTTLERLAVRAALDKLAKQRYFCISPVDQILELCCIPIGGKLYRSLRLLHCVEYGDMAPELLEALPLAMAELFGRQALDFDNINIIADSRAKQLRIVKNG